MNLKLILTIPFLVIASLYAQTGTIKGFIHASNKDHGEAFVSVLILNTEYKALSDLDGLFYMSGIPEGIYDIQLRSSGLKDTILVQVKVNANEVLNLNIEYPYCQYNEQNKTCPVCHKKDMVIPIMYGYPSKGAIHSEKRGKIWLGGCEITGCDPNWYCKRDQNKF